MKATLEFNLDELEDRMAHLRCTQSVDLCSALWEFGFNTKKDIKGKIENSSESFTQYEVVDLIYERFWQILNEHNIDLEQLIN